jgi:Ni,Fe-hydrogenase III small subunit
MLGPLRETFDVMPEPKVVIAAGVDAISGGLLADGYAAQGGLAEAVPVDVFVPGSPPTPFGLLFGILLAVGLLPDGAREAGR